VDPDPRIVQANERTLLAWIRTGLALMAFGIVLARMSAWFQPVERSELSVWTGVGVLVLGTACHAIGAVRFVRTRRAILEGKPIEATAAGPVAVAATSVAIGVACIVYVLVAQ
jgi:putative membrane protein